MTAPLRLPDESGAARCMNCGAAWPGGSAPPAASAVARFLGALALAFLTIVPC